MFNVVSDGEISKLAGMIIGSATILVYTFFGGMWAVAITDFLQMIIIVIGMLYIGGNVADMAGGVGRRGQPCGGGGQVRLPGRRPIQPRYSRSLPPGSP